MMHAEDFFAASFSERKDEYTETLETSVKDLKHSLAVALEDLDAARESQTPALAKLTARYKAVRDSLVVMLNRAGQLETDLREEQAAQEDFEAWVHSNSPTTAGSPLSG